MPYLKQMYKQMTKAGLTSCTQYKENREQGGKNPSR